MQQRASPWCLLALLVAALLSWGLSPALQAQEGASAVPEFIELTEADLQTPLGAELASAQQAFRTSLGDDPARALELAKRIVALTSEAYGESHDHVSRALTNLAIVQAENANFDAAVENYIAAIGARERASGTIVSRDLINPLRGLASAYMALDEVELAIPVFERAIHVSGVNDGPNNLEQVGIIDALSRAHYFSGDLDAADDLQDTIFRLRARQSDDNPDLYLDALEQRAAWHGRLENYDEAMRAYRRLVRTVSDQYGKNDVRLIEPLVALAQSAAQVTDDDRMGRRGAEWRTSSRIGGPGFGRTALTRFELERLCRIGGCSGSVLGQRGYRLSEMGREGEAAFAEGRRATARAVRIARSYAENDPERLARTLVARGDWLVSLDEARRSVPAYREAWEILDADPELHVVRDRLFGAPVPVKRAELPRVHGARSNDAVGAAGYPQRGYADVAFDVDTRGRARNVRIVSADPAGLMDSRLRRQVRQFRFRPEFGDDGPRAAEGLVYRHTFRYSESALSDRELKAIATTTYEDESAARGSAPGTPALRSVNLDLPQDGGLAWGAPTT